MTDHFSRGVDPAALETRPLVGLRVLDMSRLDSGQVSIEAKPFDLAQSILNSIRRIEHAADEKHIGVEVRVRDRAHAVGDRSAIENSLAIVLRNAVKFTAGDGKVSVRMRAARDGYNVFIADTGPGMSREAISLIGRPFQQFHSQVDNGMKGSGLGLAIAHSLVSMHDGRLRIRSQPGRGTVVQFYLPINRATRQATAVAA